MFNNKSQKIKTYLAIVAATFLLCSNVSAFGLKDLTKKDKGSSESSVDWKALSSDANATLSDLYAGQAKLAAAVADLALVVGMKEEAAELRGSAENLQKCGSSSCSSFKETQKSSAKLESTVSDKLGELDELSDDQKAKAGDAMKGYLAGGIQFAKGVKAAKAIADQAKSAPMTQMPKFKGLLKALPVAAKGVGSIAKTAPTLFKLMTAKGIETPKAQQSEMMDSLL